MYSKLRVERVKKAHNTVFTAVLHLDFFLLRHICMHYFNDVTVIVLYFAQATVAL